MKTEQTLAIIKPNAVKAYHTGAIITHIEKAGFIIQTLARFQLSMQESQAFYATHLNKPFYKELCTYISSGPVVVMILEKKDAITDFRVLIGATDPLQAAPGTLRKQFGTSINTNAVHGSDTKENAIAEIAFFFGKRCGCGCGC